jgi:hypothetical protein
MFQQNKARHRLRCLQHTLTAALTATLIEKQTERARRSSIINNAVLEIERQRSKVDGRS